MDNGVKLALFYIKDGRQTVFPVRDADHAVRLADAIADSDLLDDSVGWNLFDLCEYQNGQVGDSWESEDEQNFEEYWRMCRDNAHGGQ